MFGILKNWIEPVCPLLPPVGSPIYLYIKIVFCNFSEMENKNDIIDTLISDWNRERPDLDATAMHIVGRLLILGKGLEKKSQSIFG